MFCPNCGAANADSAAQCAQCGTAIQPVVPPPQQVAYAQQPYSGPAIDNYLIPSILVTVLCCLPFGIPAIIYATQVQEKLNRGDIAGAEQSSKNAKTWCIVAAVVPLVFGVLYFLIIIVMGSLSAISHH